MSAEPQKAPPKKPRSRWRLRRLLRRLAIVGVLAVAALIAFLFYLRTESGLRRVVLPVISSWSGCQITAERVSMQGLSRIRASGLRIRVPVDNYGAVMDVHAPRALLDWARRGPAELTADRAVARLNQWPSYDSPEAGSDVWRSIRRLPDFTTTLRQSTIELPPAGVERYQVPRLRIPELKCTNRDGRLRITVDTQLSTDGGLLWQVLARQHVKLDMELGGGGGRSTVSGRLELRGQYDAASRELDEIVSIMSFEIADSGNGFLNLRMRNAAGEMLTLEAVLSTDAKGWQVVVQVLGHEQQLHMKRNQTELRVRQWKSDFKVAWLAATREFESTGGFTMPGISVVLPDAAATELPPIAMNGGWTAKKTSTVLRWDLSAEVSKGDEILMQVSSRYVTGSMQTKPLALTVPNIELQTIKPYLEPFGVLLPAGKVGGTFAITPRARSRSFEIELDLTGTDLTRCPGLPPGYIVTGDVKVDGDLEPGKEANLAACSLNARVKDDRRRLLGNVALKLARSVSVPMPREAWRRPAAEAAFEMEAAVSPLVMDEIRGTAPSRRRDPQAMKFSGRLDLELRGDETLARVNLQGSHAGVRFVRAAGQGAVERGPRLKFLEISMLEVNGSPVLMQELFPARPPQFERLSVNAVMRGDPAAPAETYQYSAKIKSLGIAGIEGLPEWLQTSATLQVTGGLTEDFTGMSLADLRLNAKAFERRRVEPSAEMSLILKRPLTMNLARGVGGLGATTLAFDAACTQRFLKRLKDDPAFASAAADELVFSAELNLVRELKAPLRAELTANARLGQRRIFEGKINAVVDAAGRFRELTADKIWARCPPELQPLLPVTVPQWDTAELTGRYSRDPETPDDHRFAASFRFGELLVPQALPDWLNLGGDGEVGGTWNTANVLTVDKLKLNLSGYQPGDRKRGLQATLTGTKPLQASWSEAPFDWRRPAWPAPPATAAAAVRLDVRTPAVFLARINRVKTASARSLHLVMEADISRKKQRNTVFAKLTGDYDAVRVADVQGTVGLQDSLALADLTIDKLVLHNHDELSGFFLPPATGPAWNRLELDAKLAPADQGRLRGEARLSVFGLRRLRPLPDWLTTSAILRAAGALSRDRRLLRLETLKLTSSSVAGNDIRGAESAVAIAKPVDLKLVGRLPQLPPGTAAKLLAEGEIPYAYLARQFRPADFTRKSGRVAWTGKAAFTGGQDAVKARGELQAALNKQAFLTQTADWTLQPDWRPRTGTLTTRLQFLKEVHALIGVERCPRWREIVVDSTVKPTAAGWQLAGTAKAAGAADWPGLPAWATAAGTITYAADVQPAKDLLVLNKLVTEWDWGDADVPNQARLQADVVKPLHLRLSNWRQPAPQLDGQLKLSLAATDVFLARLRGLAPPGRRPRRLQLASIIGLQSAREALNTSVVVSGREGERQIIDLAATAALGPDGWLRTGKISRGELALSNGLRLIFSDYELAAFDGIVVKASARPRGKQACGIDGEIRLRGLQQPQWLPPRWRIDAKTDFAAIVDRRRRVTLNKLHVRTSARRGAGWQQVARLTAELAAPAKFRWGAWDAKQPAGKTALLLKGEMADLNALLDTPLTPAPESLELEGRVDLVSRRGRLTIGSRAVARAGDTVCLDVTGTTAFDSVGGWSQASVRVAELRAQRHILKYLNADLDWSKATAEAEVKAVREGYVLTWSGAFTDATGVPQVPGWAKLSAACSGAVRKPLDGDADLTRWTISGVLSDAKTGAKLVALQAALPEGRHVKLPQRRDDGWPACKLTLAGELQAGLLALGAVNRNPKTLAALPSYRVDGELNLGGGRQAAAVINLRRGQAVEIILKPALALRPDRRWRQLGLGVQIRSLPSALRSAYLPPGLLPQFKRLAGDLTIKREPVAAGKDRLSASLALNADGLKGGRWRLQEGQLALVAAGPIDLSAGFAGKNLPVNISWNKARAAKAKVSIVSTPDAFQLEVVDLDVSLPQLFKIAPKDLLGAGQSCSGGKILGALQVRRETTEWQAKWNMLASNAGFFDRRGRPVGRPFDWYVDGTAVSRDGRLRQLIFSTRDAARNQCGGLVEWENAGRFAGVPSKIQLTGGDFDLTPLWLAFRGANRRPAPREHPLDAAAVKQALRPAAPTPADPKRLAWLPTAEELMQLRIRYAVAVRSLTIGQTELADITLDVASVDDEIVLDRFRCRVGARGKITAAAKVLRSLAETEYRLELDVDSVPVYALSEIWWPGSAGRARGAVDFQWESAGEGPSPRNAWSRAAGKGRFLVKKLQLPALPVWKNTPKQLGLPGFDQLAFDAVAAEMKLKDGTIIMPRLSGVRDKFRFDCNAALRLDGHFRMDQLAFRFDSEHWRQLTPKNLRQSIGIERFGVDLDGYYAAPAPFSVAGFLPAPEINTTDAAGLRAFSRSSIGRVILGWIPAAR